MTRIPSPGALLSLLVVLGLAAACAQPVEGPRRAWRYQTHVTPVVSGTDPTALPGAAGEHFQELERQRKEKAGKQEWVTPHELDLGEHPVGEVAKGEYRFYNPTDEEQKIYSILTSCSCQKLVLELGDRSIDIKKGYFEPVLVPARAVGRLKFEVEAAEMVRDVYVTVNTSDHDYPSVQVKAVVTGVRDFVLTYDGKRQSTVYLGPVDRNEQRLFEVLVTRRDGAPFEVTGHDPLPKGLTLDAARLDDEGRRWALRCALGPGLEAGKTVGGQVQCKAAPGEGFSFSFSAMVKSPLRQTPTGTLSFGLFRAGEPVRKQVVLELVDGQGSLAPASVELQGVEFSKGAKGEIGLAHELSADGRKLTVSLTAPADVPRGRFQGRVEVRFADPALEPRTLRFFGFVQ
ncbi:MAG: hypothetical protein R3F30_12730 [Planctomycetota bacterium]